MRNQKNGKLNLLKLELNNESKKEENNRFNSNNFMRDWGVFCKLYDDLYYPEVFWEHICKSDNKKYTKCR